MSKGTFIPSADVVREDWDWGELGWISRPANTGSPGITMIDVVLKPGHGHDFHTHPDQEEVIHVKSGTIEEWIGEERMVLKAGDSVYIAAGAVHAAFVVGDEDAHLTVVLSPSVGEGGYELVDVAGEEPWKSLRG